MDVTPLHQQPTTNDEELARVLAGANDEPAAPSGLQFEESGASVGQPAVAQPVQDTPMATPAESAATPAPESIVAPTPEPAAALTPSTAASAPLDDLKKSALEELRPLIGKLNLPADEKFDTLLLIIRSTDDQSLLTPAHEAAQQIPDEAKRAQALLDIIKEIDYFSQPGQPQTAA